MLSYGLIIPFSNVHPAECSRLAQFRRMGSRKAPYTDKAILSACQQVALVIGSYRRIEFCLGMVRLSATSDGAWTTVYVSHSYFGTPKLTEHHVPEPGGHSQQIRPLVAIQLSFLISQERNTRYPLRIGNLGR